MGKSTTSFLTVIFLISSAIAFVLGTTLISAAFNIVRLSSADMVGAVFLFIALIITDALFFLFDIVEICASVILLRKVNKKAGIATLVLSLAMLVATIILIAILFSI
ncbi:MAG: hypothetical protein J5781_06140 [Clostridia bacterium]|nr:hypothetical protein [Clostridia bacterium]